MSTTLDNTHGTTPPSGPEWAGGWTALDQARLDELRRRRDAAPAGTHERRLLDAELLAAPTPESTGRRYAEGL